MRSSCKKISQSAGCSSPDCDGASGPRSDDGKNGCTYPQQLENYRSLKLAPEYKVVDVDNTASPYHHSRLLTSTRAVNNPHTACLNDPAYKDAWQYLLTEPVE